MMLIYILKNVYIYIYTHIGLYVIVDANMQTVHPAKAAGGEELWYRHFRNDSNATTMHHCHKQGL